MKLPLALVRACWLVLLLVASLAPSAAAHACSCEKRTEEELYRDAVYVAHVRVTATELRGIDELRGDVPDVDAWKEHFPEYVRVTFEEVEAFKGPQARPGYLREMTFGPGNCMLGLIAGGHFVVFLSAGDAGMVTRCSGSFGFFNAEGTQVKPVLQRLRAWAKSPP